MTYAIGDTAYADFSRYSRVDVREGKVINVSPTGVVKVQFADRPLSFTKYGRERGNSGYNPAMLITKAIYDRRIVESDRRRAVDIAHDRIAEAARCNLNNMPKHDAITKLEAAIAAVRLIPE